MHSFIRNWPDALPQLVRPHSPNEDRNAGDVNRNIRLIVVIRAIESELFSAFSE